MKLLKILMVFTITIASLNSCQEEAVSPDVKTSDLNATEQTDQTNKGQKIRSYAMAATICDINGPTVVCKNQSDEYTYTSDLLSPSVTWSVISGDITIIDGSGHTAKFEFGDNFSSGTIKAFGDDTENQCSETLDLTLSSQSNDCGAFFSDTYTGSGYYVYPSIAFDIGCISNGETITVIVDPADVPNKFDILTSSGSGLVTTSGWLGVADYNGPWGSSLNNPGVKYLTFTKSQDTYYLRVSTQTETQNDYWDATIDCP